MKATTKLMVEVLEELGTSDLQKLQLILNTREINGKTIPKSKLEKMDAINTANVIISYHGNDCLKVLRDALKYIPREDLIQKYFKETDGKCKGIEK